MKIRLSDCWELVPSLRDCLEQEEVFVSHTSRHLTFLSQDKPNLLVSKMFLDSGCTFVLVQCGGVDVKIVTSTFMYSVEVVVNTTKFSKFQHNIKPLWWYLVGILTILSRCFLKRYFDSFPKARSHLVITGLFILSFETHDIAKAFSSTNVHGPVWV